VIVREVEAVVAVTVEPAFVAPEPEPPTKEQQELERRASAVTSAFVDGSLSPRMADDLVRVGDLTREDAQALVDAPRRLRAALAREGPDYRDITSSQCVLIAEAGGAQLVCDKPGQCGGGCGNRWSWRVTVGVRGGRFEVEKRDHGAPTDAGGHCGCCK
jgi:hypothetical protein